MIRRPPRSTLFPTRRSSDLDRLNRIERIGVMKTVRRAPGISMQNQNTAARMSFGLNTTPTNHFTLRILPRRSEEHTSELQSLRHLVCRLLLEKKKNTPSTRPETHTTENLKLPRPRW